MAEHPDSLWQPWPEEAGREHAGRSERGTGMVRYPADRSGEDESRAMHILEERFARGEIDRLELEQRRAVLQGAGT